MKKIFLALAVAFASSAASAQVIIRDPNRHFGDIPYLAQQLATSLDGLADALAQRYYGSSTVYDAQRVAQGARTFAWNVSDSDPYTVRSAFGWLNQQFQDVDYQIQNYGFNYDQQVNYYLRQSRTLFAQIEQRLAYIPGPGPVGQDWRCFAVDNGWEEHGSNAHPGHGHSQWEAQQTALLSCHQEHGTCRVTSCGVLR